MMDLEKCGWWGLSTIIDLRNCKHPFFTKPSFIATYIKWLVDKIEMKAFGEPIIVEFGDDPRVHGISFLQLIETSSITGHFANQTKNAYIDIFSCKSYDPTDAQKFSQEYFEAEGSTLIFTARL